MKTRIRLIRPISILKTALERVGIKWNKIILVELPVDKVGLEVRTRIPFEIRIATKENLKEFGCDSEAMLRRIDSGDVGFLAISDNKLAGYSWLCVGKRAYIPDIEQDIDLGANSAYQYDGRVYPEFRRNNLHKKLLQENLLYLQEHDFKIVKSYVAAYNLISLMSIRAIGMVPMKSITLFKVFGFKRYGERVLDGKCIFN